MLRRPSIRTGLTPGKITSTPCPATAHPSEDRTMDHVQLSDLQLINLTMLLTIRDGVLQDCPSTCCRFALSATQADRIGALSVQQVMAIVANVGDATLFPARLDLLALLEAPLPLARPLAAVRAALHPRC
jgi:hypothetical protein